MGVLTEEYKAQAYYPEICERCGGEAEIEWDFHMGGKTQKPILNMGFCRHCALSIATGIMRDVVELNEGREEADRQYGPVMDSLRSKGFKV